MKFLYTSSFEVGMSTNVVQVFTPVGFYNDILSHSGFSNHYMFNVAFAYKMEFVFVIILYKFYTTCYAHPSVAQVVSRMVIGAIHFLYKY